MEYGQRRIANFEKGLGPMGSLVRKLRFYLVSVVVSENATFFASFLR